MQCHGFTPYRDTPVWTHCLATACLTLVMLLMPCTPSSAADIPASNKQPLSFGPGQTIIDLKNIVWEPLKGAGMPPGARVVRLSSDPAAGGGELLVYLPARVTFPTRSYTSDAIYVWIQGNFTYIAADGATTPLSGHTYIRLPGNVPHALQCGHTPCMFYVRYTGPVDSTVQPMPAKKPYNRKR